jgi:hypothetical protein
MDAQHHFFRKGRPASLARRRVRCDQRLQLSPWDDQIHFIEKFTLACSLGDQLESRVSKTYLLHRCTIPDAVAEGLIAGALLAVLTSTNSS